MGTAGRTTGIYRSVQGCKQQPLALRQWCTMTEPHPQPKCHGYACRVFEECADRYDDDEFPPCASHSSAVSERAKVLDEVLKKIQSYKKWDNYPCYFLGDDLEHMIERLRSQKGERK